MVLVLACAFSTMSWVYYTWDLGSGMQWIVGEPRVAARLPLTLPPRQRRSVPPESHTATASPQQSGPKPSPQIIEGGVDLRGASCERFQDVFFQCTTFDGTLCHRSVTPAVLDRALFATWCEPSHVYCIATCIKEEPWVVYEAKPCDEGVICPPHGLVHWSTFYHSPEFSWETTGAILAGTMKPRRLDMEPFPYQPNPPLPRETLTYRSSAPPTTVERAYMKREQAGYSSETLEKLKRFGYDLRGLSCELHKGKEQCFGFTHDRRYDSMQNCALHWLTVRNQGFMPFLGHFQLYCSREEPGWLSGRRGALRSV